MLDAIPQPLFLKDADSRLVAVNQAVCKMMGRDLGKLVGKTDYEIVPKEQADVFRAKDLEVLETGEPNENEEFLTDGDGRLRKVITRKHLVSRPDGERFIVACLTDVT